MSMNIKSDNIEKKFQEIEKDIPKPVDTSKFQPLKIEKLIEILGITIKRDEVNKLVTFLCCLSAFTESSQFNLSFNAPSSTGKSYIPTEIASLFPRKDVIKVAYCSPTAFFHDVGQFNKERGGYEVDLSRKILIFLDQPHTMLLQRLRPFLSHDEKEIQIKITDKTQKYGLKTKNVFVKGYPSVIFCSAGLKIDEQEATRFLLLSPETSQEKIREAVHHAIYKGADEEVYNEVINKDKRRKLLKERIQAIKQMNISEIQIENPDIVEKRFLEGTRKLKPRHSRDVKRLMSLIKSIALLNVFFRQKKGNVIIASDNDIEEAFKIWKEISESQELNLPPYIFNLYKEIIIPTYRSKNEAIEGFEDVEVGLTRQDICKGHYEIYERHLPDWQLRQQIVPMLETSGLIRQEPDEKDRRRLLIYPEEYSNEKNSE